MGGTVKGQAMSAMDERLQMDEQAGGSVGKSKRQGRGWRKVVLGWCGLGWLVGP